MGESINPLKRFLLEVFLKEREQLIKTEQANHDGYEKTILTLSSAFLAFSVSFIALLRRKTSIGEELLAFAHKQILIWSWICFACSVFIMLFSFLTNGIASRRQLLALENYLDTTEDTLEMTTLMTKMNRWTYIGYGLYVLSGGALISGIILLLVFCARNIELF